MKSRVTKEVSFHLFCTLSVDPRLYLRVMHGLGHKLIVLAGASRTKVAIRENLSARVRQSNKVSRNVLSKS